MSTIDFPTQTPSAIVSQYSENLPSNPKFAAKEIQVILLDIEGTTTPTSFVVNTLFPYAKEHMHEYLHAHYQEGQIDTIIQQVKKEANEPDASVEKVGDILVSWIDQDKKIGSLKTLQGLMWEDGYLTGQFKGEVYNDAYEQMTLWQKTGHRLCIYSSGSNRAQELLFKYSDHGDMESLISGHFDTGVGGKKESKSYETIAAKTNTLAQNILFLSDTLAEVIAARLANMETVLVCRDGKTPKDYQKEVHGPWVTSFDQIVIE